jgi:cysteine desulfurase / selenocysteine lyase
LPDIDVSRVRRETPGCEEVIHFNNAGCSLPPQPVRDAIAHYLEEESRSGGYETAEAYAESLEAVYDSVATLIGCDREEVALLESATRAWGSVFHALPLQPGDKILTSRQEYASNFIALLQVARRKGVTIEVVEDDETGTVSLEALQMALDPSVKLIALTHVPTSNGLVNPAADVGRIAREAGVLYLVDACQSAGQMEIDVREIGCDFLSATGRKYLRGPRGTGLLYVRREVSDQLEPIFLDLHSARWTAPDSYEVWQHARRFETWERSYAGQMGLGAAVDYALAQGLPAIRQRVSSLSGRMRTILRSLPRIAVHDRGREMCGIVTFTKEGVDAFTLRTALRQQNIQIWQVPTAALQLEKDAQDLVPRARASVHYYNTEEEIDRFAQALETVEG